MSKSVPCPVRVDTGQRHPFDQGPWAARLAEKVVKVSIGTLHNLAKEAGIVLKPGRPPVKKAA